MSGGIVFDAWAVLFAGVVAGLVAAILLINRRSHKPEPWEQRPHLTIVKTPEDWQEHDDWIR